MTFSKEEVEYVRRLAPELAEAIRIGLLHANVETAPISAPWSRDRRRRRLADLDHPRR
jgi:hypothetical protein